MSTNVYPHNLESNESAPKKEGRTHFRFPTKGEILGYGSVLLALAAIATPNRQPVPGSIETPQAAAALGKQIEHLATLQAEAEKQNGSLPNVVLFDHSSPKNPNVQRHLLMRNEGGEEFDIVLRGTAVATGSKQLAIQNIDIKKTTTDGPTTVFSMNQTSTIHGSAEVAGELLEQLGGGAFDPAAARTKSSLEIG